jgi:hypothetical protein
MIIARRHARLQASRAALRSGLHPDEIVSNKSDAHLTCTVSGGGALFHSSIVNSQIHIVISSGKASPGKGRPRGRRQLNSP